MIWISLACFKLKSIFNLYFTLVLIFKFYNQVMSIKINSLTPEKKLHFNPNSTQFASKNRLFSLEKSNKVRSLLDLLKSDKRPNPSQEEDHNVEPKSNSVDPFLYLSKFGYLNIDTSTGDGKQVNTKKSQRLMMFPHGNEANRKLLAASTNKKNLEMAIRKFQKNANLSVTGKIDKETLRMMKVPRCGHPDIIRNDTSNRKRRYALQGSKWSKSRLSFKVGKYPVQGTMSKSLIDQELKRAFDLWSEAADVEFELVSDVPNFRKMLLFEHNNPPSLSPGSESMRSKPVDIEVRFETGYHGDSEPFDGSGLILGHAYFPEFGGSTHFDAEEFWTSKSHDGVNLYQVAVHEFGHALGLEHSENFDAIMAPFFR